MSKILITPFNTTSSIVSSRLNATHCALCRRTHSKANLQAPNNGRTWGWPSHQPLNSHSQGCPYTCRMFIPGARGKTHPLFEDNFPACNLLRGQDVPISIQVQEERVIYSFLGKGFISAWCISKYILDWNYFLYITECHACFNENYETMLEDKSFNFFFKL